MKTIFRTLLLICTVGISATAFAQAPASAEKAPKVSTRKAVAKDSKAVQANPVLAPASPAKTTTTPSPNPALAPADGAQPARATDPNAPTLDPEQLTTMEAEHDTYDFGKIIQGDVVKHKFIIKNTGMNNLVLENVKPSCGCTAIDWPKEPIAPGATAEIEAQFSSVGKIGPQHKNITITYNGAHRIVYLTFTGDVVPKEYEEAPATDGGH